MQKLKVVTVVGTRPEIIRLSRVMAKLDQYCDHVLVHTGQNYDYELNEIFFQDLHWALAAEAGHPLAARKLAELYRDGGPGLAQDSERAEHYAQRASALGL